MRRLVFLVWLLLMAGSAFGFPSPRDYLPDPAHDGGLPQPPFEWLDLLVLLGILVVLALLGSLPKQKYGWLQMVVWLTLILGIPIFGAVEYWLGH